MANLLDTIRSNLGSQAGQQAPRTDETYKIQKLQRARTGKAVGDTGPRISNIGEQVATDQTQQGLQQVGQQAELGQQQLGMQQEAQQQEEQQARSGIEQGRRFNTIQNQMRTDQMLGELERQRGQLDLAKDKSKLEQVGQNLRLQNTKYIDNLQMEGSRSRLDNDVEFKQQMAKSVMGDNNELLKSKLSNQSVLGASKREFNNALANLSVRDAIQVMLNDSKAAQQRAGWEAGGAAATTGIGAYGTYKEGGFDSDYQKSKADREGKYTYEKYQQEQGKK